MNGTKSDSTDQMIHLWKRRTGEAISREEAQLMIKDLVGFFRVLLDWDSKSHHQERIIRHHVNKRPRKGDHEGDEGK